MTLGEVLQRVRVGDSFYRASKPEVIYERIGTLIERDGLGWASVQYSQYDNWEIVLEMSREEDNSAEDWVLQRDVSLKDFDSSAAAPRLRERGMPMAVLPCGCED